MSESVRVGGIGKNPAIDKINKLNAIDVKNYAVKKMEDLLLVEKADKLNRIEQISIDLSGADWEGKGHGRQEGNQLFIRFDGYSASGGI